MDRRTLRLRRESLGELTTDDLTRVVGAGTVPTYPVETCVAISGALCWSNDCYPTRPDDGC